MRKAIVIAALILLLAGIVSAVSIQESHTEEGVLDTWDPIIPSELPRNNETGWAFMRTETSNATFLELNITASDVVRVRIGIIILSEGEQEFWAKLVFDDTGTHFAERVAIAGTGADFLGIKNEGEDNVTLSGDINKIGNRSQPVYPYLGLGTSVTIFGLILLVYGVSAKPKKRRFEGKSRTSIL
jgi:hypothetical protein